MKITEHLRRKLNPLRANFKSKTKVEMRFCSVEYERCWEIEFAKNNEKVSNGEWTLHIHRTVFCFLHLFPIMYKYLKHTIKTQSVHAFTLMQFISSSSLFDFRYWIGNSRLLLCYNYKLHIWANDNWTWVVLGSVGKRRASCSLQ